MAEPGTNNQQISEELRRRAEEYARRVRAQYGDDAAFESVDQDLANDWASQSGNESSQWTLIRGIVKQSWGRRDTATAAADALANDAAFSTPPTFSDSGSATPRNRDEPNQ